MGIRITGGSLRGRQIPSPVASGVRPSGSRLRESFFNIISSKIDSAVFWDLYAGSGIMGLEALSRGAKNIVQVDKNSTVIKSLKSNYKILGVSGVVIRKDVSMYVNEMIKRSIKANIIYVDPPFIEDYPDLSKCIDLIEEGGVVAFEFPKRLEAEWLLKADDLRNYGESSLAIFYG